ncbi:LysR family transcriptional regulator [Pseudoalteromonas rubra]|uniref:LysR family transcriptional regulator n=1 Tax=Pseudoalteromonas rubra TaxID=43658 RepID=A0A4Q7E050_9GAMM|nr:LysR family transcriptional regulator [Pseudoalteromonas rubra]RZM73148.1 LysR family transcriptional regulator [Pseudoalteromonas rubra]
MPHTPNFEDIRYFIEVAGTRNLSRASERLGITQPSVSAAMKRLEQSFGTDLLVRHKNGVALTKAGEVLQEQGQRFMTDWSQLKSNVYQANGEMAGTFTLGCHPSVALYTLPHILGPLNTKYPGLIFNLVHDLSRKVTEQVISNEIDFALVINPVRHPELVIHSLLFDNVTLWCAQSTDVTEREALPLYCDPNLKQTQQLLKSLPDFSHHQIASNNLEVISALVASGLGLGILPERVARRAPAPLTTYSTKIKPVPDELCFIYRADKQNHAVSSQLHREIKQLLSD